MAKKYTIQLEVDQTGAIQNIDKVAGQLDTAASSAQNLKQQLREMQKQLSTLDVNSDEFQKLSKQAGELKDRIKDASEAINRQAGSSFERLSANAGNLKESLLNLDFEQVGSSLKGIAGTVKGFTFQEFGAGLKNITSGFATLGKALLTNPLFLIITGATLFIANFEKIATLFDGVTSAQQEAAAAQQAAADSAKAQYDQVSAIENSLKVQGKSEKEILALKKEALNTAILNQKAAIETQQVILDGQVQAAERNKKFLKGAIDFLIIPLQFLLQGVDKIGAAFGQDFGLEKLLSEGTESIAKLVFDPEEVKAEGEKTFDEARKQLAALENTRDGYILQEREKNAAAAAERRKAREDELKQEREKNAAAAAERRKAREDELKQEREKNAAAAAERRKAREDELKEAQAQALKLFNIQKNLQERIEKDLPQAKSQLSSLVSENDERLKLIESQRQAEFELNASAEEKEIAASDEKYIKLREMAAGNAGLLAQITEQNEDEVAKIKERYAEQDKANRLTRFNDEISSAANLLSAFGDLVSSFTAKNRAQAKRQFEITKGVNIALALANTYLGATSAYAQTAGGPIIKGLAAAAAVAAGLANVNRIRQQKFEGGSTSDGGGGSVSAGGGSVASSGGVPAGGVPQFNPVNTDFVNNRPPQPAKAFVIATEARSAIEASEKVEQQARL